MEASPALPPLRLKFIRPNEHEPIEAQFTARLSGAAIRYLDAQGRVLVHIPLSVPDINPNGEFELPALVANFASASGTVAEGCLVDRQGEPLGIGGEVTGPHGGPLRVEKGQIVEASWEASERRLNLYG